MADDEQEIQTLENLRKAIIKLDKKHGDWASPLLREVDELISRYEVALAFETYHGNEKKLQNTSLYLETEENVKKNSENLVDGLLRQRPYYHLASKLTQSPLANDLSKRNEVWKNMVVTERTYFMNLTSLIENYYPSNNTSPSITRVRTKILTEKQTRKIFQNIEHIKEVTRKLLKSFEVAPSSQIGVLFKEHLQDIQTEYTIYIRGFPEALKQYIKTRKGIELDDLNQTGEVVLPLSALLMLPLLHVCEYEMFLRDLNQLTLPEHADHKNLEYVKDEFGKLVAELALSKPELARLQKVLSQYSTNLIKGDVLSSDHRALFLNTFVKDYPGFIREGPILFITEKKTKECYIYLFSNLFVIADVLSPNGEKHFNSYWTLKGNYQPLTIDRTGQRPHLPKSKQANNITQYDWGTKLNLLSLGATVTDFPEANPQVEWSFSVKCATKTVCLGCYTKAETFSYIWDFQLLTQEEASPHVISYLKTSVSILSKLSNESLFIKSEVLGDGIDRQFTPTLKETKEGSLREQTQLFDSDRFVRSLQCQRHLRTGNELIEPVPPTKISRLSKSQELQRLDGPEQDHEIRNIDRAAGRSISLFPFIKATNSKMCDPNTDRNRTIFAMADGFREGQKGARAAEIATKVVIEHLKDQQPFLGDMRQAGRELLYVMSSAHEAIIQSSANYHLCGTSSLLAGILLEVELQSTSEKHPRKSPRNKKKRAWTMIMASVGNCRAYLYSARLRRVTEITSKSNLNRKSITDPGGRLGPYIEDGCPDLRNFHLYICQCIEEDMIFVVSNGVYDNFDPENLGHNPRDIQEYATSNLQQLLQKFSIPQVPHTSNQSANLNHTTNTSTNSTYSGNSPTSTTSNTVDYTNLENSNNELPQNWDEMDLIPKNALKSKFTSTMFAHVINESFKMNLPLTPTAVVKCILDYCSRTTKDRRRFLKQFPNRIPPTDHVAYPGVLDHATCICFEVKRGARFS